MTLAQWSEKYGIEVRVVKTNVVYPRDSRCVYCNAFDNREAYADLFWLDDYKVSTVSGPVVWVVPPMK